MVSGNQEQKELIDAIMTNLKAKTTNKNTTNKEVINIKKNTNSAIIRPISRKKK